LNKKLKLLGLLVVLAMAGAAWAVVWPGDDLRTDQEITTANRIWTGAGGADLTLPSAGNGASLVNSFWQTRGSRGLVSATSLAVTPGQFNLISTDLAAVSRELELAVSALASADAAGQLNTTQEAQQAARAAADQANKASEAITTALELPISLEATSKDLMDTAIVSLDVAVAALGNVSNALYAASRELDSLATSNNNLAAAAATAREAAREASNVTLKSSSVLSALEVINDSGVITLESGQELVLQPGASRRIGKNDSVVSDIDIWYSPGSPANNAGMLRLNGGTTTIYGGNNNMPQEGSNNNFNGGTYLNSGHLRIAHSNAFGEGHVMLNAGSRMTVFNSDTSLGYQAYDNARTSLSTKQHLILRRDPRGTTPAAYVNAQRSYTANAVTVTVENVDFTIYSGVREFLTGLGSNTRLDGFNMGARSLPASAQAPNQNHLLFLAGGNRNAGVYGATLVKNGSGRMTITSDREGGAWHTRGTDVTEGDLLVTSSGTAKYAASLGATWPMQAIENASALANYDRAFIDGIGNVNHVVPYKNHLRISEGASVTVNRDQFFGHFSGKGRFTVNPWNFSGSRRLPQITIQTDASYSPSNTGYNRYAIDSDLGAESTFEGPVSGQFDLVLNTGFLTDYQTGSRGGTYPVAPAGPNAGDLPGDRVVPGASDKPWRKILRLTSPNNNITDGDTTIVDGILSVATVGNLPPNSIYVGSNATRNGYKTDSLTSAFVSNYTATLHAYGTNTSRNVVIPQRVTVATPVMGTDGMFSNRGTSGRLYSYPGFFDSGLPGGRYAGLAANSGVTMTLNNVEIFGGFVVNEEMRVDENVLNAPRGWEGTISFADRYVFRESTLAVPTRVVIDRGTLHLEKRPADRADNGRNVMKVQINPTGVLSLGAEARDFTDIMDVTFGAARQTASGAEGEDDQRIRLVVLPEDLKTSRSDVREATAIFNAGHIDYIGLGSGERNRDKRIVIQLDLFLASGHQLEQPALPAREQRHD